MGPEPEYLSWDSEFFGFRVARATDAGGMDVERVLGWCVQNAIEWLYILVPAGNTETTVRLERESCNLMDIRLELGLGRGVAGDKRGKWTEGVIRLWEERDIKPLRSIAGQAHIASRFYHDPRVPFGKASALYEVWIEKSCTGGLADVVLVADMGGRACGYVTGKLDGNGSGYIGLVGVAPHAQGRGVGRGLVSAAVNWLQAEGCDDIRVVTQGRNVVAQRVYQSFGFQTTSVHLWYHRWFI